MTTEKKAKKYDEAIEIAKKYHSKLGEDGRTLIESIFSELKESKDEKIRKEIFHFILENTLSTDMRQHRWLAWLEKQGRQKWSDEDEENLRDVISAIHYISYQTT